MKPIFNIYTYYAISLRHCKYRLFPSLKTSTKKCVLGKSSPPKTAFSRFYGTLYAVLIQKN